MSEKLENIVTIAQSNLLLSAQASALLEDIKATIKNQVSSENVMVEVKSSIERFAAANASLMTDDGCQYNDSDYHDSTYNDAYKDTYRDISSNSVGTNRK